jgi:N-methylhydantoinase B
VQTSNGAPLPPKISTLVPADTVVTAELPGGGGYGSPAARDPARVLEDVREGYVSTEQARSVYGVAIDPITWTVLADETARLRASMPGA